ncbi:Acg family FMN-binding oxidoreductase [Mucilaginibacter paludis]|uniref:Nitroreductase n=1 Tax=Mucilaginibacter paludis DSM 18603 TaxID=714943 RepID=H1YA76_9SPHI|nr:nitroreductase [Mucilaginibacter paludis]EHQ25957.1 nitroreductase [Mucilaginibacter paludis DSM 18603]
MNSFLTPPNSISTKTMDRKRFLGIAAGAVLIAGSAYYLTSDTSNLVRDDINPGEIEKFPLKADEEAILFLASLAPSGHNTQPWFIKYVQPYHWLICNDRGRWLPGVDPQQRETILSIGAFVQNLEYAAHHLGYYCKFTMLAATNQDENILNVILTKTGNTAQYDIQKIKLRRTIRSEYLVDALSKEDLAYLINGQTDFLHFVPNTAKEYKLINEQTIEANRQQAYRNAAQAELATWIRFTSKDTERYRDGLTLAGMEIEGLTAWYLRNFYDKTDVMKSAFRQQSIDQVKRQVSQSAGWLLISSKGSSVNQLLETGMRMQRLFVDVRGRNIAIHPMTQILEETNNKQSINQITGISDTVQFVLRTGYVKNYPQPVSLRRPVDWFIRPNTT